MCHEYNTNGRMVVAPTLDDRPYAMLGAGRVTSSLWKHGDPDGGWVYRFNVFRLSAADGQVSQLFEPADIADLVKCCRVLATELLHDGCLSPSQRQTLAELAARLTEFTTPCE